MPITNRFSSIGIRIGYVSPYLVTNHDGNQYRMYLCDDCIHDLLKYDIVAQLINPYIDLHVINCARCGIPSYSTISKVDGVTLLLTKPKPYRET